MKYISLLRHHCNDYVNDDFIIFLLTLTLILLIIFSSERIHQHDISHDKIYSIYSIFVQVFFLLYRTFTKLRKI